jgi:hypothetical protein
LRVPECDVSALILVHLTGGPLDCGACQGGGCGP